MADKAERSSFYDKILQGATGAQLLTEENINLEARFRRGKYEIESHLNFLEMYVDYHETLTEADEEDLPEVVLLGGEDDAIEAEIERLHKRAGERWLEVERTYRNLEQLFDIAREDWERYIEEKLPEHEFLERYGLEEIEAYPQLEESLEETEERISRVGVDINRIGGNAAPLPNKPEA